MIEESVTSMMEQKGREIIRFLQSFSITIIWDNLISKFMRFEILVICIDNN